MLPRYVTQSRCSPNLYYPVPVFPGTHVSNIPQSPCFPVPMSPSPCALQSICFPVPIEVHQSLCSPVPIVPHSYSTEVFSLPFPIFATHDPQALCSPVPMPMTLFKIHFLQYGHSYYVYILNRYYLCSNELVCAFSLRLEPRVTFEFGWYPFGESCSNIFYKNSDHCKRVPQPLYRLANNGPFSYRLANNSKIFIEYRISVCYRISNKYEILIFLCVIVNTRPCVTVRNVRLQLVSTVTINTRWRPLCKVASHISR